MDEMSEKNGLQRAVFYDLDGTLVKSNIVHTYAYFARNMPSIGESILRVGKTIAYSPFYLLLDSFSRKMFNRFFYTNYKGFSQARLRLLGKELVKRSLLPNFFLHARSRIEIAHDQGLIQVLVTGSIREVVESLRDYLPINYFITNQLEFINGYATGKVNSPILAGEAKKNAIFAFAKEKKIDLAGSYAFGDSIADLPMLFSVGFPCTVNPDARLKRIAKKNHWPILHFK